jgi:hypothetical protein
MKHVATIFPLLFLAACSSLTLKPVDFSWPIEAELKPDRKGVVQEERYTMSVNVTSVIWEELKDSTASRHTIHMIRDVKGYYYITAAKFKNVYVFKHGDGELVQANKILVSESGLTSPAFNQRAPNVQLINGKEKPILLSNTGVEQQPEGAKK